MTGPRVILVADDEAFHVDCQPTDVAPGQPSPYRQARVPRTDSDLPAVARLAVRRLTCDACGINFCDEFDAEEEDALIAANFGALKGTLAGESEAKVRAAIRALRGSR